MMKVGSRRRRISNAVSHFSRPHQSPGAPGAIFSAKKGYRAFSQASDGSQQAGIIQEDLKGQSVSGSVISANGSPFAQSMSKVDRFNPVHDDLSKGTVAEDWIPLDPRKQNQMFWMMFHRGNVEGPVVETIAETCWSDFDLTAIRSKEILDTYQAAKEAVRVDRFLPEITTEMLVVGRWIAQLVLDKNLGIWTDLVVHDSDYIKIEPVYRTGFMPKLDVMPSPDMQRWVRSQDPRDIEARKGLPPEMLEQLGKGQSVPLDPEITVYLPRKTRHNDVYGTSFFVRNIPLWGLEKSLYNATLTGHRRRSGPITQIAVGSEIFEPTPEQIDAITAAYTAAEEDGVSSTIGTRHDVVINQVRGGLQEMWKLSDEADFIYNMKLRMFGFSEQMLTGEANLDLASAPTMFLERLKAHRRYVVETFLMQKFFRGLATVHNFRKRSEAELAHRIRVQNDDSELILPTCVFHKNLDATADAARADLLEKMEEKGLPVTLEEWNRSLGGGELNDRLRSSLRDMALRVKVAQVQALSQKVKALAEAGEPAEILQQSTQLLAQIADIEFPKDDDGYEIAELSRQGKKRAKDMVDSLAEDDTPVSSSAAYEPMDTSAGTSPSVDRSTQALHPRLLSGI